MTDEEKISVPIRAYAHRALKPLLQKGGGGKQIDTLTHLIVWFSAQKRDARQSILDEGESLAKKQSSGERARSAG